MARKKKNQDADASGALSRMQTVSSYVAACSNPDLLAAFNKLPGGEQLYAIFVNAVNDEVEGFFRPEDAQVEDGVDALSDKVDLLANDLEAFRAFVQGFNNERLFSVLNVVMRNFGGMPVPPPQANPAPQVPVRAPQPEPTQERQVKAESPRKSLKKRFAATDSKDVAPEAPAIEPQQPRVRESDTRPAAPTMPPRGGNIMGFY